VRQLWQHATRWPRAGEYNLRVCLSSRPEVTSVNHKIPEYFPRTLSFVFPRQAETNEIRCNALLRNKHRPLPPTSVCIALPARSCCQL
jgi:hypothetical protein